MTIVLLMLAAGASTASAVIARLTSDDTARYQPGHDPAPYQWQFSDASIPFGNPASPPTVVTGAASAFTQTSATLNATVNPNGSNVSECKFEYGTTTAYGFTVPCSAPPGSVETPVAVSASVTGLVATTTYHFRISATNPGGTSKGSDHAFSPPSSPTVLTEPASSVTQTSASLNATVNPTGSNVSECKFEYGTTSSYGFTVPCSAPPGSGESPVPVAAALASLVGNTTYHFRISATNSRGTGQGKDETFKTLPNAPTVVTGAASSLTQTSATLNATVNPNGGEVSECKFEYGTSEAYGSSVPCQSLPGSGESAVAVSASVMALAPNTMYHFRISATNAGGTSKGSDVTLTTLEVATPTVATGVASAVTQSSANLNATVNPNGGEVIECKFEYGPTSSYELSVPCSSLPGHEGSPVPVSAPVTGLSANTSYHFRIVAKNSLGTNAGSDETLKTLPNPPTVLTEAASAVTQTSATLNATVNPNGGEGTQCKYEYGTTTAYELSAPCSSLPGTGSSPVSVSAPVTGLSPNTTYHFRISATGPGGTSKGSDEAFTTPAKPAEPIVPVPVPPPPTPPRAPNSNFQFLTVAFSRTAGGITFTQSVSDPGTFTWLLTFPNGKFGVYAAKHTKCNSGFVMLSARCRPSQIVFARGSETFATEGVVSFTLKPTVRAMRALRNASKKKTGVPVTMLLTFQSSRGGTGVSHTESLIVKLKKK